MEPYCSSMQPWMNKHKTSSLLSFFKPHSRSHRHTVSLSVWHPQHTLGDIAVPLRGIVRATMAVAGCWMHSPSWLGKAYYLKLSQWIHFTDAATPVLAVLTHSAQLKFRRSLSSTPLTPASPYSRLTEYFHDKWYIPSGSDLIDQLVWLCTSSWLWEVTIKKLFLFSDGVCSHFSLSLFFMTSKCLSYCIQWQQSMDYICCFLFICVLMPSSCQNAFAHIYTAFARKFAHHNSIRLRLWIQYVQVYFLDSNAILHHRPPSASFYTDLISESALECSSIAVGMLMWMWWKEEFLFQVSPWYYIPHLHHSGV